MQCVSSGNAVYVMQYVCLYCITSCHILCSLVMQCMCPRTTYDFDFDTSTALLQNMLYICPHIHIHIYIYIYIYIYYIYVCMYV
jgi:hypothetical protein